MGKTEVLKQLDNDKNFLSLPEFTADGKGSRYVWCGNKLQYDSEFCPQGLKVEIPVMADDSSSCLDMPLVEYLY